MKYTVTGFVDGEKTTIELDVATPMDAWKHLYKEMNIIQIVDENGIPTDEWK